jgi:hypothetical protein
MDLQEQTRMNDLYVEISQIIDKISELPVFPSLVWVWTWDVALSTYKDFQEDPEFIINKNIQEVWELFYTQADENAFSLEYGTEDLYEAIRDWMIDADIVSYGSIEDEEDEDEE